VYRKERKYRKRVKMEKFEENEWRKEETKYGRWIEEVKKHGER
jgi:hypothetical protein